MIRAFATSWSVSGRRVTNPIQQWLDNNVFGIPVVCSQYYADADRDGFPDKREVIIIVEQDDNAVNSVGQNIENFNDLFGVRMIHIEDAKVRIKNIQPNFAGFGNHYDDKIK